MRDVVRARGAAVALAVLAAACGGDGLGTATDDFPIGAAIEAPVLEDLEGLADAADLVVRARIVELGVSDIEFPAFPEAFAVAAIALEVEEVLAASGVGPAPADGVLTVHWALDAVSSAESDLKLLGTYLPSGVGWWFLRHEPTLRDQYRVVNTASVLEVGTDGRLRPSLYRQSAEDARGGRLDPAEHHAAFIRSVVEWEVGPFEDMLRHRRG